MVEQFAAEEDVETPDDIHPYSYDDILSVTFKLVNAADFYQHDEEFGVWKDKSDDKDFVRSLVEDGEDLHVVGVVQPREDASATMLSAGLYYPSSLTRHVIDEAAASQIVKDQLAKPDINVFTGKPFGEEEDGESAFDMESLFTIDGDAIQAAFTIDESKLAVDMSSALNLQGSLQNMPEAPEPNMDEIAGSLDIDIPEDKVADLMGEHHAAVHGVPSRLRDHDASEDSRTGRRRKPDGEHHRQPRLSPAVGLRFHAATRHQGPDLCFDPGHGRHGRPRGPNRHRPAGLRPNDHDHLHVRHGGRAANPGDRRPAAVHEPDGEQHGERHEHRPGQVRGRVPDEHGREGASAELMMSLMGTEEASYDNNLKKLGYADLAKPSGIDIYPIDFESKEHIIEILDAYNDRMKADGEEDKVITYTDLVGTLMSSVTDIVNMISYVLVAFVAISLVVSSIMIGVITYISVLERKKEIGILRSIGASKGDISRVFNAETIIVGFTAGVIGIGVTALACIPANAIIYSLFDVANVAALPWQAALVLIGISVFLTFLAGLIPSSAASRKDPVEALRSE